VLFAVCTTLAVASCNSKADDACENVGDCEQGGSSDWIMQCQVEAKAQLQVAEATDCAGFYDVYYRCADDNFKCEGATASFPGCEAKRANLDDCLARNAAKTSCGDLETKTASCKTMDAGPAPLPAPTCTATRECTARCYLNAVADVCAPLPSELEAMAACAQSCPP
jgi:hypothetical protein